MARDFQQVGVVGLGTMGAGIVEVFARSGLSVVAVEKDDDALRRGRGHVEGSTKRAVDRGKLTEAEQQALLERVQFGTDLAALAECDLVVEAVPEQLELKRQIFGELDRCCKPETILASNTSSLSVTEIAVATGRPSKVVGMHFFNPAPVMKLVEVIRSVVTEQDVVHDVEALVQQLGKTDVTVGDRAGFIANALLFGYLNHAVSLFESHYASREDIDAAMKLGCGLPMGPLALLDLIGIDTAYEILDTMYAQSRDRLHAPQPIFKQMMTAGLLGRKTGKGFYTYEAPDSPKVVADSITPPATPNLENARPVSKVGVVGSGTMATGIIEVFAKAGYEVTFVTRAEAKSEAVVAKITKSLDKAVGRGKLTEADRDATLARRAPVHLARRPRRRAAGGRGGRRGPRGEGDAVRQPRRHHRPGTVLATTTSSLPVVKCAAATSRPEDVIGMHFFNPAAVMKLVEVVSTVSTSDEVEATVLDVTAKLGKHAVRCADRAGFIVNTLLFPYLNDAVKMLEAHYATADDIDAAMKVGCGYPMGPFELLDVVGNDVSLAIERELFQEFREPGFAPAPLLEHLVTAGRLGRKVGKGFRDY